MKRLPYLKSFSATILSILNFLLAVCTFLLLFRTVFTFGKFVGTMIRSFQFSDYSMVPKFFQDSGNTFGLLPYLESLTDGAMLKFTFGLIPLILSGIAFALLAILLPVLTILNGFGSLSLRFHNRGSHLIQIVHVFHCIINVLWALLAVFVIGYFLFTGVFRDSLKSADSGSILVVLITLIVLAVLLVIMECMAFCYHKNVAQHMSYITSEIQGASDLFEENHLSGLSFFFGAILLIPIIALGYLLSLQYNMTILMLLIICAVFSLKYFLVCICNHRLKKTIWQRNRRTRR